jgi:predicted unusual protein kinase regulating ubiquinone biosynthesis (AarF/ABC1/UbiB family)
MTKRIPLPESRFERAARLARMGAATGLGLVTGKNTELLAEQATAVLGTLRGMAAKVGQIASTVEGMLPESLDATFSSALSRLRDQTDTSPYPEVRAVIESELGGKLTGLFSEFSEIPMASASIGQVHRAKLLDGRAVAVKVQHPGIERAMESDLSNAKLLQRLASNIVPKGFDSSRTFDEVLVRFREELDYRIEATHQTRFSHLHQRTLGVTIPNVIASHSTRRVLTTELVEGRKFDEVLRDASAEEKLGYAQTLWRFVFRSILIGGEFNADPHPGNYLFGTSPSVTFLDFGCVQRLAESRRLIARSLHQAAIDRDETRFRSAVCALLLTRGGVYEAFAVEFTRRCFAPLFSSPYRISPAFLRDLFSFASSSKLELLKDRSHATAFPADLALLNRLQFGFYSLLAKLDVEVDYAALERELLAENSPYRATPPV